jgi:chromosome segregation ATPase
MERDLLRFLMGGPFMRQIGKADRKATVVLETIETELVSSEHVNATDPEPLGNRRFPEEIEYKTQPARIANPCLPSVRTQADVFLNVINGLKSVSDRVCDAADREVECSEPTEQSKKTDLASLRLQLKEESLKARSLALREIEEAWKAKVELIQNQLRGREIQLRVRERDLAGLTSKVYGVINRINQAESESQNRAEQLETEITELRHQLKEKDERLAAKRPAQELELKKLKELQDQLQTAEGKLQSCEAELEKKENLIRAAAAKEAELGKLITHLSSECEKLSSEPHDNAPVAEQEKKQQGSPGDPPVWKKILGRIQEQPV